MTETPPKPETFTRGPLSVTVAAPGHYLISGHVSEPVLLPDEGWLVSNRGVHLPVFPAGKGVDIGTLLAIAVHALGDSNEEAVGLLHEAMISLAGADPKRKRSRKAKTPEAAEPTEEAPAGEEIFPMEGGAQ